MNLVFVSMGGWGKVLFGDSLVYSKGHIPGCQRLGDPKAPFHPPETMELSREIKKKKKSHWIPPTSAAQFYPFNFSSGIPWEIPGGSYSRAVWGSTATGSQSQRQIPRDEEQDLPWPGSLVIRTSSKAPPKGLQNALPKIFPAPAATAHLALPRKKGE